MARPRIQYFDQGNFAAGNGGYVTLGGLQINMSKWTALTKNIIVPTPCTGSQGVMTYRTVGTTTVVHVECNWDFVNRNDNERWFNFINDINNGAGQSLAFDVDSNTFSFYGLISDAVNTNAVTKGYNCVQVTITDILIVSSQEQDDVVKIVIDGVCNAPFLAF